MEDYYQRHKKASSEEKLKLEEEKARLWKQRTEDRKRFQRRLFAVATPIGIIAIIVDSLIAVQAVGTGVMLGGDFTLMNGYISSWSALQDWMRFSSFLIAFIVLIFIGYRKLAAGERG